MPKLHHRLLVLPKTNRYKVNNLNQVITHTSSLGAKNALSAPIFDASVNNYSSAPPLLSTHHANKTHIWVLTNLSRIGRIWRIVEGLRRCWRYKNPVVIPEAWWSNLAISNVSEYGVSGRENA
ncbi:Hypothetical predicted protein [Olea europaea subsp. europaea]|uniref:Uncharacterized protein n=1 Tax=Olea europaea subsp. europaea TaxID=158383 RepID=A0A8S0SBQ3_OLEEU|nr:Hypothetical predicted protein [Olea europaea subsp. europaea]